MNSHPWILRANPTEFVHRWAETTNQAITRCLCWGKIKLKTLEEETELIENISASDHAILRDKTHRPTKKSLLELTSHDALLAQNKLQSKHLEILTEPLGKLPTKLSIGQPTHSSVLQVTGCTMSGKAHETSQCIPTEENTQEIHFMGNQ